MNESNLYGKNFVQQTKQSATHAKLRTMCTSTVSFLFAFFWKKMKSTQFHFLDIFINKSFHPKKQTTQNEISYYYNHHICSCCYFWIMYHPIFCWGKLSTIVWLYWLYCDDSIKCVIYDVDSTRCIFSSMHLIVTMISYNLSYRLLYLRQMISLFYSIRRHYNNIIYYRNRPSPSTTATATAMGTMKSNWKLRLIVLFSRGQSLWHKSNEKVKQSRLRMQNGWLISTGLMMIFA